MRNGIRYRALLSWEADRLRPWDGSAYDLGFPKLLEVTNDAGARTYLYPKLTPEQYKKLFHYDCSDIVYNVTRSPRVLVIGVGGGKDILSALHNDAASVVGVELNPVMIDVAQDIFADFTGRPYDDPRVHIAIDEGRNYLASHNEKYDVIKISVTDTWAASAVGAYALVENYLYTIEAMRDYMNRLTPGGYLSVTRWYPQETLRMTALAAESLRRQGYDDPQNRIVMVTNNATVSLLVKNGVFLPEESARLAEAARTTGLGVIYAPGQEAAWSDTEIDKAHRALMQGDLSQMEQLIPTRVTPPTDDQPFFFNLAGMRNAIRGKYGSRGGFILQHGRALSVLGGCWPFRQPSPCSLFWRR